MSKPTDTMVLVPRAKLEEWKWTLERNVQRGHVCDLTPRCTSVAQAIGAVLSTNLAPLDDASVERAFNVWVRSLSYWQRTPTIEIAFDGGYRAGLAAGLSDIQYA